MSFQNKYLKYKNKYLDLKNKITQKGGSTINTLKQQSINVGDLVRVTTTTRDGTTVREGLITEKSVDMKTQLSLFIILHPDGNNQFEVIQDSNTKIVKIDKIINIGDFVRVTNLTRDGTTTVREGLIINKLVDMKTHLPLFIIQLQDNTNSFEVIQDSNTKIEIIDKMYTLPKPYKRDDMNIKLTEQEQINNLRERISNLEFKNEKLERNLNNHYHELPTSGMRLYEEQHPFFKKS